MNKIYYDNITRTFGFYRGATFIIVDKSKWFTSDFTFEELEIGMKILNGSTGQESIITGLTSNSVEVYNTADKKSVKQNQKKEDDDDIEIGKLKGVGSKCWYDMKMFNETFKKI